MLQNFVIIIHYPNIHAMIKLIQMFIRYASAWRDGTDAHAVPEYMERPPLSEEEYLKKIQVLFGSNYHNLDTEQVLACYRDQLNSNGIDPQFFENCTPFSLIKDYVQELKTKIASYHLNNLIQFCTLLHWLHKAKDIADVSVALVSYASGHGYDPLSVFNFVGGIFEPPPKAEIKPESVESVAEAWRLLKGNKIFPKLSLAISAMSVLTVCTFEKVSFDKSYVELLSESFQDIHASAIDVVDACIESLCWMCSSGVAVIKQKSLAPLLYSDQTIHEFDEKFMYVQAEKSNAINGSLMNLAEYESKLQDCINIIERLNSCKLEHVVRRYLHDKYAILVGIQDSLYVKRKNSEIRFCPIGFCLYGGSGVGKTSVAKMVMRTSLYSMGFSTDEKHQITMDMNDKYHSTLTNDIEGVYFDDLANTTSDFSDNGQIPSSTIIKFFNNVPAQAVKADVGDKGKTMLNLKCGVVTTNVKHLDAAKYSNCPVSILRRLYHVTVTIKPQYQIRDSSGLTGMLDQNHADLLAQSCIGEVDVWNFTIETAIPSGNSGFAFSTLNYPINGVNVVCKNIGLRDFLLVVRDLSVAHHTQQQNLLAGVASGVGCSCPKCKIPKVVCGCQAFFMSWWDIFQFIPRSFGYLPVSELSQAEALRRALLIVDNSIYDLAPYIPSFIYNSFLFQWVFDYSTKRLSDFECSCFRYIRRNHRRITFYSYLSLFFALFFGLPCGDTLFSPLILTFVPFFLLFVFLLKRAVARRNQDLVDRVVQSRGTLSAYATRMREVIIPQSLVVLGGVAAAAITLRYLYRMYVLARVGPENGSSLDPDVIDKQPGWTGFFMRGSTQKIVNPKYTNHTPSQLVNPVSKNLFFATFTGKEGGASHCCLFMPKKHYALFPKHIFYADGDMNGKPYSVMDVVVRRSTDTGGRFLFTVNFHSCQFYGDICLAYVPSCPDLQDLTSVVSEEVTGAGYCELVKRQVDIKIVTERVYATHGITGHKHMSFYGSTYTTSLAGRGSCMSVLISVTQPSSIVGFHLGGRDEQGISGHLPQSMLRILYEKLRNTDLVLDGGNSDILPESTYGKPFVIGPVHHSAYVRDLPEDSCFTPIGQTAHRSEMTSHVVRSLFYDAAMRHFEIEDKWKIPELKPNWKHFNVFLDKVTKPSLPFDPLLLRIATYDYLEPLMCVVKSYTGLKRPLTFKESVMGIPGMRFCDGLVMKTSLGYPIFGKKAKWFTDVYEDGVLVDRVPHAKIVEEYHRLLKCYRERRRGYPVFSGNLKDEVKDRDSMKIRIFTACPVAFSILVRMFFLPVVIFFQHYPIESEMAVGINAFGLQWQDLMDYVDSLADKNGGRFGMDYSAYDTRMNSQISRAAYWIMIKLARAMGYDEDSLYIMESMVDDLTHPIVDVNGTMVALYHMNPSGNNVTVQVNCLANSIYMRMAFFSVLPNFSNFRDWVHLTTYGDDNRCSVAEVCRSKFTFLKVQEYLLKHDIVITPPDKKSEGDHFFEDDKLDFLKRQSSYIPEIDRKIGRLEEDSILRSFLYNVKSASVDPQEVALSCVDSAMHEWFAFGRDHYEKRRSEMKLVCEDAGILHYPILDITFEDRVKKWKENYME